MKTGKIIMLAAVISIGFAACADKNDDKVIEVESKDRLIERDRDKTEVDIEANDGKVGVGVENDEKKVDIEIGKDKDDKK